jgi:chromosome segregation ATPase
VIELEQHIKRINEKLQQLLKNYSALQKENERQEKLIDSLKRSKEADTKQIGELQEKISVLKMAAGQMNDTDKKEFEKNISRYIKEIDKCIGMLSE